MFLLNYTIAAEKNMNNHKRILLIKNGTFYKALNLWTGQVRILTNESLQKSEMRCSVIIKSRKRVNFLFLFL